ncbi:fatty acid desaturase [Hyalangium minutum]|uniref:Fatty acid desaturase n=1 Tax=Hyalangium minutum TaxID=394096 RepID=A0A085WEJ6_9BACT|nr:fatty acid desaturase [Hyalangium minutum]KFE66109.1 Fatty acid desaturase [Hyalangium minutum]
MSFLASVTRSTLPPRVRVPPELLVRPELPELVRQALTEWGLIAACWVGMAWVPAATPLFVLLIAGRMHAFGVILHDAVHLSVRRKSPGIWLLECLAGYPVAATWNAMRYHHLRHHHHEGSSLDAYSRPKPGPWWRTVPLGLVLILIVPGWTVRGLMGLLAWAVPALRNVYGRAFLMDRSGEDLIHSPEVLACSRAELGQVLLQLGVLALAWRWPYAVGVGYVLPLMVASAACGYRLLAEHTPLRDQGRTLQGILASTADHGLGWLGRLLLAPRNVGLHIVHHLHPQVAASHLPRLRAWYLQHYPEHYPRPRRF